MLAELQRSGDDEAVAAAAGADKGGRSASDLPRACERCPWAMTLTVPPFTGG
jgi:hypothetical protein